jgi:DNA-binding MarR family transcriptional regulator
LEFKYLDFQGNILMRRTKADLAAELVEEVRASQVATEQMDEAAARALGINRTDRRCMDIVDRLGAISAGQLAQEAALTTGSVTAVIDRLERKGYLRRVADPSDRRRVMVEITGYAAERARELWGPMIAAGQQLLGAYTAGDLEILIDFTRRGRVLNERRAAEIRASLLNGSLG